MIKKSCEAKTVDLFFILNLDCFTESMHCIIEHDLCTRPNEQRVLADTEAKREKNERGDGEDYFQEDQENQNEGIAEREIGNRG